MKYEEITIMCLAFILHISYLLLFGLFFHNFDAEQRFAGLACAAWVALRDGIDHIHAFHDFAKHGVFAVEMRRGEVGDEKLRTIRMWARIRHRQNTGATVLQAGVKFVFELVAGTAAAGAFGIAALHHEVFDHAVEGRVVVKAVLGQEDEVINGVRHFVGKKLNGEVAFAGVEDGAVFLLGVDHHRGWVWV